MLNPIAPFRIALSARNVRLLLAGLAASQAGDWLYNLALLAYVYERTHSSTWVGITTAVRIVPEVVLGSLGGVVADRVDRRLLMLGSDGIRVLAMAALTLAAVLHGPVVLAPVMAALCTAAGSAYAPCVVAVLPRLASDEQLPAANAARVSLTYICVIAGPLFGAALLLIGPPAVAFAINGATFLIGALVVSLLPRHALRRPPHSEGPPAARMWAELAEGWSALRSAPAGLPILGADIAASAVYGALTVLLVLLAQRLGLGTAGYGYLLAAAGLGGVLATGIANRVAGSARVRPVLAGALLAVALPLPLLALSAPLPAVILLIAVVGGGSIVTEVVGDTALQRSLDPAVFGRAYGLVVPASVAGIVIGALVAPVCVSLLGGLGGAFAIIGAAVAVYGVRILYRRPALRIVNVIRTVRERRPAPSVAKINAV
jgi:predicted MFS family arabinose efflux permease